MSRRYYSEYVAHCLRFYARNQGVVEFHSSVDRANWIACHTVFAELFPEDREMLRSVYEGRDTLADEVYNVSKKYDVEQGIIWDKLKKLERDVARVRGLIPNESRQTS